MTSITGSSVSMKIGTEFQVTLAVLGKIPTLVFEDRERTGLKAMTVRTAESSLSLGWLARDPETGVSSAKVVYDHQAFLVVWRKPTDQRVQPFDVVPVEK
jgi:hypothetical protein